MIRRPINTIQRGARRAFNLVELLIALGITGALLTATLVALDASYFAYQKTTEVAGSHMVSRMVMNRVLTLIRTGRDFAPFPADGQDSVVNADFIQFIDPGGRLIELKYVEDDEALYIEVDDNGTDILLLEGVVPQYDGGGDRIKPFQLEWKLGRRLYRATIDMAVVPDDNQSVTIDGNPVAPGEIFRRGTAVDMISL